MAHISKSHSLGRDEAKKRIERMIPKLSQEYNLKIYYKWEGDYKLVFEGSGAKGSFLITDNSVEGDLSLSFLLKVMEGKIVSTINGILDEVLK